MNIDDVDLVREWEKFKHKVNYRPFVIETDRVTYRERISDPINIIMIDNKIIKVWSSLDLIVTNGCCHWHIKELL